MQDKDKTTPIIQTKLHRLPLPVGTVKRLRLTTWLNQRGERRLTLGEGLQPGTSAINKYS